MRSIGGAALWTLAQHASFFACAWGVSWWAGADRFGAYGQGLALTAMLSAAITFRLEYAGQLERRHRRAEALFSLAERGALACGLLLLLVLLLVDHWLPVPIWLWASMCAVFPQAGVLVLASQAARRGDVVRAAALRSGPALVMVLFLLVAWGAGWNGAIEWSIPVAAWVCWIAARWLAFTRRAHRTRKTTPVAKVAAFHAPFVRAELPAFLLNASANHGQVLLIGVLGGDAVAGVAALALRIAMLPTSVFGLALADRLRARVVSTGLTPALCTVVHQAIRRMSGLSLVVHGVAALGAWWLLPFVFPAQGSALVTAVLVLLPLGAIRFVASPLAFVLPWRGWLGLSLIGQCLLFACALCSVLLGFPSGGLMGVAAAYAISAAIVYLGYVYVVLAAVRTDT